MCEPKILDRSSDICATSSPYSPPEIVEILYRNIEDPPLSGRSLLYGCGYHLNGISPACGKISGNSFEFRNRSDWQWSAIVKGHIHTHESGSKIYFCIKRKNSLVNLGRLLIYGLSQQHDLRIIIDFL